MTRNFCQMPRARDGKARRVMIGLDYVVQILRRSTLDRVFQLALPFQLAECLPVGDGLRMILESGQAVFRGKLNDKRCGRAAGGAMARSELFRRLHVPEHQEECQVIDRLESAADEQRPGEDTGSQEKPA